MGTAALDPGLETAAKIALLAPSIHNTQPWRWRVAAPALELRASRDRQLAATDPLGRLLTISCGAALHHARVALSAEGIASTVERFPDDRDPELLARITATGRGAADPAAVRALETIRARHTDRRPVAERPVDPAALTALAQVARNEGTHLHVLPPDGVLDLASAAARAQRVESLDPDFVEELAYWVGGTNTPSVASSSATGAGETLGLPADVIPATPPQTTVPGRDFGHGGTLPIAESPVGGGHDRSAAYAILYGDEDAPGAWLRAGEALSAVWLAAIQRDLSVLPLSAVVEVEATRATLRHLLSDLGEPLLVLRVGVHDPVQPEAPHTGRLRPEETIDRSGPPA
jgi:nitroreductase